MRGAKAVETCVSIRNMTLRDPLPGWHCRLCKQPIDQMQLRLNPGAIHCWECEWKLKEALDGRR